MSSENKKWAQNYSTHSTRFLLELRKYARHTGEALEILEAELLHRGLMPPFEPDRSQPMRPSEIEILQKIIFGPNLHGFRYSINCEIPFEIADELHISTSDNDFNTDTKVNIIPTSTAHIADDKKCTVNNSSKTQFICPIAFFSRIIAILVNSACLVILAYFTIKETPRYGKEIFLVMALWAYLIVNLVALIKNSSSNSNSKISDVWPFITIKRKTLEEREKINKLTSSNNQ